MTCKDMECKEYSPTLGCTVYSKDGSSFRMAQGYCPIPDKYFSTTRQERYWKEQHPNEKRRVGQQKQKRK